MSMSIVCRRKEHEHGCSEPLHGIATSVPQVDMVGLVESPVFGEGLENICKHNGDEFQWHQDNNKHQNYNDEGSSLQCNE